MWSIDTRRPLFGRRALQLLLSLLAPFSTLLALASSELVGQPARLLPHHPTFLHLSAGGCRTLTLDAQAGEEAELLIETSAPGADFTVVDPSGRRIQTIEAEQPGWLVVSVRFATAGLYQLVPRAESTHTEGGGISLHLDLLPPISVGDRSGAQNRAEAEAWFSSAQILARSPHAGPIHTAINQYRKAAADWAASGDRESRMLALAGEARAWFDLSDYANTLATLNRARNLSLQMPWFRAWFDSLEAQTYLDRWDSKLAKDFAQEAVRLSHDLTDPWLTAGAFAGLGEAEYLIDDPSGQADIEEALKLGRESDADEALARALRCRSWMESDEGHEAHAMAFMRQAEEQFRNAGQARSYLDALANLSTIQRMDGDPYAALVGHSSIEPLMQGSGKLSDIGFLLASIANDYLELNRIPDAVAYYKQAIETFRRIGLLSGESMTMSQLCMAETGANHLQAAMRDCLRAKATAEELQDPKRVAVTIWRLGKAQRASGRTKEAIESFRRAFEISARVHDPYSEVQSLIEWGDTLESEGNGQSARELYAKAIPLSEEAENPLAQIEARYHIARSEFESGQTEDARRDLTLELNSIDVQRRAVRNPNLRASYFAQVHQSHELLIELLMRQHQSNSSDGFNTQALEVSESGRALTLLDTLTARDNRPPTSQYGGKLQEPLETQTAVERAYDKRLRLTLDGARKSDLDANEAVLTKAIDTLERIEDERKFAMDDFSPHARPLSADEIIAASRALHTTLVEYSLGMRQSYVWVVDGGKVESYVLPARRIIESSVREWRLLASTRIAQPGKSLEAHHRLVQAADAQLPRVAHHLSCMLLAPFLRRQMKQLVIVPDGELNLLPFAAIPEDGCHEGGAAVAASHQVMLAPSLSILLIPHQRPDHGSWPGKIALFADPVFDRDDSRVSGAGDYHSSNHRSRNDSGESGLALPRLFGSRDEATAIAALVGPDRSTLFLDFDASLQTLLAQPLDQYWILHLATHGVFDEDAPDLSAIILSLVNKEGEPVFGYLRPHDVENLTLRSDLVVLSSCDSSAGVNLSGEGTMGLTHAFLTAGATRVVSTLWGVDDETSKRLMVDFYTGVLREGLEPGEALRRSQLKTMGNPETSAPYYWAGFTLTSIVP